MTKKEYRSIRGEKDFLFRYYKKEGGVVQSEQQFSMFLNMWLMQVVGIHPKNSIPTIVDFLDKKFG